MPVIEPEPHPSGASDRDLLRDAIEHARHLLPSQAPLHVFVHHNTLHAFEDLHFDEAVVRAAAVFGAEPYLREEAFALHVASGRITPRDIAAVLEGEGFAETPLFEGGPTQRALRELRLLHPLERMDGAALAWRLEEGGLRELHAAVSPAASERLLASAAEALGQPVDVPRALGALYARLAPHAPAPRSTTPGARPRDRVLATHGIDVDEWVHPLVYRLCAAFVDQGVAYWSMPGRDRGFLSAFRALYGRRSGPPDPWLRGLSRELAEAEAADEDAEQTVMRALGRLGVHHARWAEVIERTLLAIPGWAGMMAQLEARPDLAPVTAPPARLVDFLAVVLTLEAQAVHHASQSARSDDFEGPHRVAAASTDRSVLYDAFVLAQLAGLGPAELDEPRHARALLGDVAAFGSFARRRLWHLAYEHHHRQHVLDALLAHDRARAPRTAPPRWQVVTCIDDRAESVRRHLEELDASIETAGAAGFFGVPMAFRGLTDVRPRPMCPVVIRPRHVVVEEPIELAGAAAAATRRKMLGAVRNSSRVGSHTIVRGGLLSFGFGLAAVLPLVGRVLAPRLAERVLRAANRAAAPPPPTRFRFERAEGDDAVDEDGLLPGFTVREMADIVGGLLRSTGLAARLAPLVVIVGHGSSSLNNPHEAAYDCGATGGGRGGPNARVFALMANHPDVRAELVDRGAAIPETTWFVGAAHDTAADSIEWYDLELVPEPFTAELARARDVFARALPLDAHERCRRFESAPLGLDPEQALLHVERRVADLAQPRPECGHATNAILIVGRRERTRGLFLDRRAFLVSYDPTEDAEGAILGPLLASVGPVGAGINLEYYFSFVDPEGYGCGTKLPHNVTGLVGVMNGYASDLRTGLPWQMVEIHEPVRLLTIVEAEPELLERLLGMYPEVSRVVLNHWIQLVAWSPSTGKLWRFEGRGFVPHVREARTIPTVATSLDHYRGQRGHLGCARVVAALSTESA